MFTVLKRVVYLENTALQIARRRQEEYYREEQESKLGFNYPSLAIIARNVSAKHGHLQNVCQKTLNKH